MNILIVTAMFPPIQTGTSFYSKNLAEALVKKGHKVILITLKNNQAAQNEKYSFKIHRLKAFYFPLKNFFKHLRICSFYPGNYRKILQITNQNHPDAILLINHYLDIAFPAIYAARKNNIPLVVSVGTQLQSLSLIRNKILNILDKLICGGLIFPNCQKIIAWDREIFRYLKDVQGPEILKKTVIVPYGVNGQDYEFNRPHEYLKSNQIIGVGAIIEQRNFIFLIKIFAKLLKKFPDLRLKIIGHVYYNVSVKLVEKLKISDKVIFTGEKPHETVMDELKKSIFYWGVPSGRYTGLGTATLEAMLLGVPIITNIPEDLLGKPRLKDMENFIYSDGKSITKTLKRLEALLSDRKLQSKIGRGGRKFVQKNLSWHKIATEMAEVLKNVKA